jgi:hypothetical protein
LILSPSKLVEREKWGSIAEIKMQMVKREE